MGCTTSKPVPVNTCNTDIGELGPPVQNFCTMAGVGGDGIRNSFCSSISNAGEWNGQNEQIPASCNYSMYDKQDGIAGVCIPGEGPGTLGAGLRCRRSAFTGDPLQCCLNDYDYNHVNSNCFSDSGEQRTCPKVDPLYPSMGSTRNITSDACQNRVMAYCTGTLPGDDPNSLEWMDRWNPGGSCIYALYRNMFAGVPGGVPIPIPTDVCGIIPPAPVDSRGLDWGQRLIKAAMLKYESQGFVIGSDPVDSNGSPARSYHPFQNLLYSQVCCPYSALCQTGLSKVCSNKTADSISTALTMTKWCGCHLPGAEYQEYSAKFNIPRQCNPTCNRPDVIPITSGAATPVLCDRNICIIDNSTINLLNTNVGGMTNISQICGSCGAGQCACSITNTDFTLNNTTVGGNLDIIRSQCGTLSCVTNSNQSIGPDSTIGVCTDAIEDPLAQYKEKLNEEKLKAWRSSTFWTIVVLIVSLFIMALLILFIKPILDYTSVKGQVDKSQLYKQTGQL